MSRLPSARASEKQFGFDLLLEDAEQENARRRFERETAHLPETMEDAVPFYRVLVKQHHAAMLAGDVDRVMAIRNEARLLATKLDGGQPGILADENAPGCVLEREAAAAIGTVPKWGRAGDFTIRIADIDVRITIDGIFGIGCGVLFWPGFRIHAVDYDKPFLSETGYRSFLGIAAMPQPGLMPDEFVTEVLHTYREKELKGKALPIDPWYRSDKPD